MKTLSFTAASLPLLIRAGVTIVDATKIPSAQTKSKALKRALEQVEDDIRSGITFSSATNKQPKVFPPLFTNMMRSRGSSPGTLED